MNVENEVIKEGIEMEEVVIDSTRLKMIIKRIVELEIQNVKTKEFNENEMKKKIEKIIEEEVVCY